MSHPRFTRGGTLIMDTPNVLPTFKRRRSSSRGSSPKAITYVPKRNRRSILNQVDNPGPEKKNVDNTAVIVVPAASAWSALSLINGVAQGAGQNERIGRKTIIKSVQLRYSAHADAGTDVCNRLRVAIIYDKQPNGALTTANTIFSPGSGFNDMMALGGSDRFVVIADEYTEQFQFSPSASAISGKIYKKVNLETIFATTTANIADINSGALLLLVCSDGINSTTATQFNFTSRVRYIDN